MPASPAGITSGAVPRGFAVNGKYRRYAQKFILENLCLP